MNIYLPKVKDNSHLGNSIVKNKKDNLIARYKNNLSLSIDTTLFFVNKTPTYNKKYGCFVLSFINRTIIKSIKNFQLCEKGSNTIYFQFGKTGKDSFIFDFKHPFSPIQAFAIAVSSLQK